MAPSLHSHSKKMMFSSSPLLSSPSSGSPMKSTPSSSPAPSPRLRSPRGSSPRHPAALMFGILRHSKVVLAVAAAVAMLLIRPSSMDPGSNVMTFMDPSFVELLMGGTSASNMTTTTTSSSSSGDDQETIGETASSGSSWNPRISKDHSMTTTAFQVPDVLHPTLKSLSAKNAKLSVHKKDLKLLTRSSTVPRNNSVLLATFEPFWNPLLEVPRNVSNPSQPVDVPMPAVDVHFIVDIVAAETVGPQSKFLLDGMERSPYVNVVGMTFLNPNIHRVQIGERQRGVRQMVWVIDWGSMQRDCHRLKRALEQHERTEEEYVLLVDYSGSTRQSICESDFPNDTRIRLAKRSVVANRRYDHKAKKIELGEIALNLGQSDDERSSSNEPAMQASLIVRERFVTALLSTAREGNPTKSTRRVDVCFFWKPGDYSHYGFWRRDVSNFVEQFGNATHYTTLVDVVANDEEGMDTGNIQLKYVKEMLRCKIIVVAQRDEWEDHYRLYESLASGALVLMDPMLAPPEGLRNKTNVLVYDSLESLDILIRYHLENASRRKSVARRGMELALGRYRSWHRVEQLLFGQALYQVDKPLDEAPPKMTRPQITLIDGTMSIPT